MRKYFSYDAFYNLKIGIRSKSSGDETRARAAKDNEAFYITKIDNPT